MSHLTVLTEPMKQGSPEWLEYRRNKRNASETPAVMGHSPWFPKTHIQLARVKRGLDAVFETKAMRWGTGNEERARQHMEELTGLVVQPTVVIDGDYSASLDGRTFDGEIIVEIKCPASGSKSNLFDGDLPMNYFLQVQHQLMVSKAKKCVFFVWAPGIHRIIEVFPNETIWANIRAAWDEFWPLMSCDESALTADVKKREDSDWFLAVERYRAAKTATAAAQANEDAARDALIELADGFTSEGFGVKVTSSTRAGNVNYKAIPELKGVDLSKYRGAPIPYWTVREVKENDA